METLLCISAILAVPLLIYLFNTAPKKVPAPAAGKKEYTPVYLSIADDPDMVIQGMKSFVAEVQKTESAGDKWRWIPMYIFLSGLGLMVVDGVLLLTGYRSFVFTVGGIVLWIAALVLARSL